MARMKMITIRVDEAEHALFKGAAAAVPVSISEYARDAMLARMALEQAPVGVPSLVPIVVEAEPVAEPWVINSPAEAEEVMERVAARNLEGGSPRPFTPYSKEQQTGKAKPRTKVKPVVTVSTCRHGLLRCKVCGTG